MKKNRKGERNVNVKETKKELGRGREKEGESKDEMIKRNRRETMKRKYRKERTKEKKCNRK